MGAVPWILNIIYAELQFVLLCRAHVTWLQNFKIRFSDIRIYAVRRKYTSTFRRHYIGYGYEYQRKLSKTKESHCGALGR